MIVENVCEKSCARTIDSFYLKKKEIHILKFNKNWLIKTNPSETQLIFI